jgi:glycosyltransferase involved in cell wall biosynthesis
LLSSLSVVIPSYNEEGRLPVTLQRVNQYLHEHFGGPAEILVVNDGSTDATAVAARSAIERLNKSELPARLLENPGNRGKGYSVRHGVLEASHEWVLFTDADLSAPIEELEKLAAAVEQDGYDIAIGSRGLDRSLIEVHQSFFRETMGRFFNLAVRIVAGLPFRDTQCGFKLFSRRAAREVFRRQQLDRFGFDVETLFIARKLGLRIAEVPVRWSHCEGTKVTTLSGASAFLDICRVRRNDWSGKYQ